MDDRLLMAELSTSPISPLQVLFFFDNLLDKIENRAESSQDVIDESVESVPNQGIAFNLFWSSGFLFSVLLFIVIGVGAGFKS